MASVCGRARQAVKSCCIRNGVVSNICSSKSSSKLPGFTKPTSSKFTPQRLFTSTRRPVELGAVQSLMPLHSATASALFTSLLSVHAQSWGSLSEGTILDDS